MNSSKEMRLVFFRDAIEHVTRIVRMITTERGNALLVGVGGTGEQSLTRLAAHMCGYNCFQIELTRGYGYDAFHEDMRKVFKMAVFMCRPGAVKTVMGDSYFDTCVKLLICFLL